LSYNKHRLTNIHELVEKKVISYVDSIMVLKSLEHMESSTLSLLKNKAKDIFIYLKDLETGIEMESTDFLNKFQISETTYILAPRNQLKRPQIF
jgi:hypothetical protein